MTLKKSPGEVGATIVLSLDALFFLAFGVLYILIPEKMAAGVGIQVPSASALIDLQGLYGGLEAGLGAYLGLCVFKSQRNGLFVGSFALGGIAMARVVAVIKLGLPDSTVLALLAIDVAGALLNLFFLRRVSKTVVPSAGV